MSDLREQYTFRDAVADALADDILGPTAPDETIDEAPLDRYLTGVLYPAARAETSEQPDDPDAADGGGAGEDSGYDPGVALSRMRHPSSIGLSFAVDTAVTEQITLVVGAGRYEEVAHDTATVSTETRSRARNPRGTSRWRRIALKPDPVALPVDRSGVHKVDLADRRLQLYCVVRERQTDGATPVTVVLRNTASVTVGGARDAHCWFQPSIKVTGPTGCFVPRRTGRGVAVNDEDLESYDLLFRDVHAFAVGHGCAVDWETGSATRSVAELTTTFLPSYELRLATPRSLPTVDLRMQTLSSASDHDVTATLRAMVIEYRRWIAGKRVKADALPSALRSTAERHLGEAETAADRIESGIDLLADDPEVMLAFRLMNQSMQLQRARQDWIRGGAVGVPPEGGDQAWRPFQIAFILLSLQGIARPDHDDRDIADLLWFPTGGGKTEAYLGLIAITILLRRLVDANASGVSVLMRYTLRLLTLQQFERAASLVCALETLRTTHPRLQKSTPISLGLWVGRKATPNSVKEAGLALNKLARGQKLEEGNPVQLTRCPWCGTALNHQDYKANRSIPALTVSCRNPTCAFARGLPVHLVDEDVYRVRPSLLIGTVDKFAALAWREEAGTIFSTDGKGLPPDLIVQDELHLISGPLGTLVGLYETAVDAACNRTQRPKVVASTATIRRAGQQMRDVFDRASAQFPPSGLTVGDTFFSQEADPDEKGTRRYVGVMAPGTSQTTLMVRTYAAMLHAAHTLPGPDDARDPYWTLVGYFNSLRVLGGAFMQVIDDVPDRLKLLAQRAGVERRDIGQRLELTSRTDSTDIPLHLERLAETYPSENAPDVVLATNMISVGVDVDRLGLMTLMGQPQATAEYIQASSRVGRKHPGLVVVLYNSARSRDRSHYEGFLPYHQAVYRQVEATSATPFAARARDRGLHGVLVSLARLLAPGAAPDAAAGNIRRYRPAVEALAEQVVDRVRRIDPDAVEDTEQQLQTLIDLWDDEAEARGSMRYSAPNAPMDSLLVEAGEALTNPDLSLDTRSLPWPTLTSLRDVDSTAGLYLIPNRDRSVS